jgi:hypothetical protein
MTTCQRGAFAVCVRDRTISARVSREAVRPATARRTPPADRDFLREPRQVYLIPDTGEPSLTAAERAGAEGGVVATDISAELVALADAVRWAAGHIGPMHEQALIGAKAEYEARQRGEAGWTASARTQRR